MLLQELEGGGCAGRGDSEREVRYREGEADDKIERWRKG